MNKILTLLSLFMMMVTSGIAQRVVQGTVSDKQGNPIPGVTFYVSGNVNIVGISDEKGNVVTEELPDDISWIYYTSNQPFMAKGTVLIEGNNAFKLIISEKERDISFGRNISTSLGKMTQAFGTVNSNDLDLIAEQNVASALYGKIAGLSVMQNSGANMDNAPALRVRGNNSFNSNLPLILIDGVPRNIGDVSIPEIDQITVLKDATAAAIYGVRGANGVIQIKTKRGNQGKTTVNVGYQYNHFTPFRAPEMVDAATYANLYNEALINDGLPALYSQTDIDTYRDGSQSYTHPNVDWYDEAYDSSASSQIVDITAQGGTEKFKYFTSAYYANEEGLLKSNMLSDREDHKLGNVVLNIRSNIDVQLYRNTRFSVNVAARLGEFRQPNKGYQAIARSLYAIPALAFPVYSPEGVYASTNFYGKNPIADINSNGFRKDIAKTIVTDFRLYQDLSTVIKGLSAEAAISYDAGSVIRESGNRNYQYHVIGDGNITAFGEDTPMNYSDKKTVENSNNNIEAKLNYQKQLKNTLLNTSLVYHQSSKSAIGRNNRVSRQSLMAYAALSHQNKYLLDAVVNYSGSSVMPEGDQFRLFPAINLGWIASNEKFMKGGAIDYLKIRTSFGLSGNDSFDHDLFLQQYAGASGYFFTDNISTGGGVREGSLPVIGLNYEIAQKFNLGFDLELFKNRLAITGDLFYEYRDNMLVNAGNVVSGVIGVGLNKQVNGIIRNKGLEVTALWEDKIGDVNYEIGGNFAFARNEIVENNEGFVPYSYLSRKGSSIGANWGLEAIGYFSDENDIANSPQQAFGEVAPGDIKYKDQNNDNIVDQNDRITYGHSGAYPEIYFGFQFKVEYKNVGISGNLQGVANRTIYTSSANLFFPLVNGTNISSYYVNENTHWTEATKATANMPRLTTMDNPNNFQPSTHWFKNGNYLKLRNVELYYNLNEKWLNGVKAKLFVRGANLFSIDNLKHFDPENIVGGYPSMSSVSIGAQLKF
ncbi:SusC/RagA family TonB-linked outer membrane protein [Prolixibacteraceae bacterium JC049]|nr:SusC/RagA family TonB-linked outer membrane protein [Prolixibacteraceae bacterium JC049]